MLPVKGQIRYDTDPDFRTGKFVVESAATTEHSIRLTSLKSDTKYYYSVEATDPFWKFESTEYHFFTTPPAPGVVKKTKIWVLGDFGTDGPAAFNTRQDSTITAIKNYMDVNGTGPFDLWLWLGDNAYDIGADADFQNNVFDKGRARYDWAFRQTPFYATPGNHDYGDGGAISRYTHQIHYYNVVDNFKNAEAGGEPSNKEEYYSFDYSNIHFISLDTYGFEDGNDTSDSLFAKTGVQYQWLQRDLAKAKANPLINWVIVFTHMPPYTGGTHDSDIPSGSTNLDSELGTIRRNLVPLLDSYKVDLYISGHSHNYERSRLMRNHLGTSDTFRKITHNPETGSNARSSGKYDGTPNSCFYYKTSAATTNEGIIYVVNGGGGRAEYFTRNRKVLDSVMYTSSTSGGSMYIEVDNKKLTAKYVGTNKQVVDQFVIYKDLDNFSIPPTDGSTRTATCECTEALGANNGFTHYTDNKANLLLSVNKHGTNIGTTGVLPFEVKLLGSPGRTNIGAFFPGNYVRALRTRTFGSGWRVMNRYWTIKPAFELTGSNQVTIRHYFRGADFKALSSVDPDDQVHEQLLKAYKINNLTTNFNLDPTSGSHSSMIGASAYNKNGIWVYDGPFGITPSEWKWGIFGKETFNPRSDGYYGEYVIGRLAGGGGIGAQVSWTNPRGSLTILQSGKIWNYLAKGVPPASGIYNWKGHDSSFDNFDYSNWQEGNGPFGYSPNGEDKEKRVIPGCQAELNCYVADEDEAHFIPGCLTSPCQNRWTTYYFRTSLFNYWGADPFYQSYIINYKRDDGVIIYINGKELTPRDPNMPNRTIYDTTFAFNAAKEYEWQTIVIPNDNKYFRSGGNIVAVELHQTSLTSSDLHFDMDIIISPDVSTSPATRLAAINEKDAESEVKYIYPNPTDNGKVFFAKPLKYQTMRLTDSGGRTIRYAGVPGALKELDLSASPAGIYILNISENINKVSTFKIVKE